MFLARTVSRQQMAGLFGVAQSKLPSSDMPNSEYAVVTLESTPVVARRWSAPKNSMEYALDPSQLSCHFHLTEPFNIASEDGASLEPKTGRDSTRAELHQSPRASRSGQNFHIAFLVIPTDTVETAVRTVVLHTSLVTHARWGRGF